MSDDRIDWISLELELTESPAVLEMLDELNRRLGANDPLRFDPDALAAIGKACQEIVKAFGAAMADVAAALADLVRSYTPTIIKIADLIAELDRDIAERSRRTPRQSPTLNRRAHYAPPRDLRATEAPRRPPTIYRRRP